MITEVSVLTVSSKAVEYDDTKNGALLRIMVTRMDVLSGIAGRTGTP